MAATPAENAALVRGFLTDVVAGGDVDAVGAFLGSGVVDHNLVFGDARGRDAVTALGWRALAAADVDVEVVEVVATGGLAAAWGRVSGTHRASLLDLAPTGASFDVAAAWFFRIDDGRIAEIWTLPDGLGLVRQLGGLPEPPVNCSPIDDDS